MAEPPVSRASDREDKVLVGVNYFAGWWEPQPNKWTRRDGSAWLPDFPDRRPLLGKFNDQASMDREIRAAADHGVDFFSILWYYSTAEDQRESHSLLLNRGLDCFTSSPEAHRMKFMIEFCNHPPYQVTTPEQWQYCIEVWKKALSHPSCLQVDGRRVFKVHGGHYFLVQNGNDLGQCRAQLDELRSGVRNAGLGELLIGCGVGANDPIGSTHPLAQLFDFTSTYMDVPGLALTKDDWEYEKLAQVAQSARVIHATDAVPYMPYLPAGWNPRPWGDPRPSFRFPSRRQWEQQLRDMMRDLNPAGTTATLGLPTSAGPVQAAFTIYAWNEFGEGGIVAPTEGDGTMKLEAIREVFGSQ